ncbi:MAG TPA: MFS transporter [Verrucomicrobia bacterium]|nr:MAG: MFS transporter [Lentisphaerae bacterium GWF2_57_35]HBA82550.1 MFS transporter [Verrucomicrobiota bacterium]
MEIRTHHDSFAALRIREIRYFLGSVAFFTLANRAAAVLIGLQIYKLTHSALALGWLGLVEAIPALSLAFFGGHVADRVERRRVLLWTRAVSVLCAVLLAVISWNPLTANVYYLYAVIFLAGIARGFSDPAQAGFEAQVVPERLTVNASSWIGSTWVSCAVIGPAAVGFAYDGLGIVSSYAAIAACFALSWGCTALIAPKPLPPIVHEESMMESILGGLKFVLREQALVGAMALDLFAVLFGGAVALLPIYATDILHVGARGLGLLQAATYAGSLLVMMWSTRRPPIRHAGRNLLVCVAGFGICIIVFALSRNFLLSLLALALSGVFDGVSMVIRRSIVRLLSPDRMRGRIAAVNMVFIGASNEIGAFESGVAAHWLGAVPAVWVGGVATLFVVAATWTAAPRLRRLGFDPHQMTRLEHDA